MAKSWKCNGLFLITYNFSYNYQNLSKHNFWFSFNIFCILKQLLTLNTVIRHVSACWSHNVKFFQILINSEPYFLFHYIIIKDYVKVFYKEFCYFNETFSSLYGIRKVVTHFTYAKYILPFFFKRVGVFMSLHLRIAFLKYFWIH